MGSLALLQQIFLTQELNQGLLHCRWIFYQLKYQRSPTSHSEKAKEYMIQTIESGKGKTLYTVKKKLVVAKVEDKKGWKTGGQVF